VTLDETEIEPLMLARLLQYLYYGIYEVTPTPRLTNILARASSLTLHGKAALVLDNIPPQTLDFEIHAAVYALADRFEIGTLKADAAAQFVADLRSKDFSIADLIAAVEIVYTTTPETDSGLRKWVVYRAQQVEELGRHDGFEAVMKGFLDFAYDFATKYARANHLWCSHCKDTVELVECRCGFWGMCGDPICKTEVAAALMCTRCGLWGKLRREIPRIEGNLVLGELGRTDEPEAPVKRSPKKKKRFA
jgi:hypothetical protein